MDHDDMARVSVEKAFVRISTVFTGDAGMAASAAAELDANEAAFKKKYGAFMYWPSDAQLAFHLMGWVNGVGFNNPPLRQAVNRIMPDFAAAATCCDMPDRGHPAIVTLNSTNRRLFATAHRVLEQGLAIEPVYCEVFAVKPLWL